MPANRSPAELVPELARLAKRLKSNEWERIQRSYPRPPQDAMWETPEEQAEAAAESARLDREFREWKPALDALLAEFRVETPAEVAACAEALASLPDSGAAIALANTLMARGGFDAALVVPALEKALSHEFSLFRAEAGEGIVSAFRLESHLRGPEKLPDQSTEVELWQSFLRWDLPVFRGIGVEGMRGLVRQLQAGATLESLGLAWKPDRAGGSIQRLRSALMERAAALPVEEMAQLTGSDRYLAEAMMVDCLSHDGRMPAALARLGATWTVPLLKAFLASPNSRSIREEITQALRTLESADQISAERGRESE